MRLLLQQMVVPQSTRRTPGSGERAAFAKTPPGASMLAAWTRVALCALSCFALAGCIWPRAACRVGVWNATDEPIASVVVRNADGSTVVFSGLRPHSGAERAAAEQDLDRAVLVEVRNEKGVMSSKTVDLGRRVPKAFRGRILFQIEPDGRIKGFLLPDVEDTGESDLPWAMPSSDVPGIPGMSEAE
jgi:hypothetical protein